MTVQETIEKAVSVGYKLYDEDGPLAVEDIDWENSVGISSIFLDPLFWQSLGEALGWPEEKDNAGETQGDGKWHSTRTLNSWLYHWHDFIDHLVYGSTPELFFKPLIK